jgi:hypothetical protein
MGEWFKQDISTMEKTYARKSSQNMYAEIVGTFLKRCLLPVTELQKEVLN